ncbi:MAG: division/cell wall cluster transcriptional repressor MraZ [Candidatus Eisenbacteria bacterium]|nr:division/cell wall cluster transcriptional repressor MraZ [Candidatus Eisenbacteria bacterium]
MERLFGSHRVVVDSKGRLIIPAAFRKILFPEPGRSGTLTLGYEHCVALYPPDRWEEEENLIHRLPFTSTNVRRIARMMGYHAKPCALDAQGRIVLSKDIREYAKIDREALVLGVFQHIEIFNPEIYEAYQSGSDMTFERAAEELTRLHEKSRSDEIR